MALRWRDVGYLAAAGRVPWADGDVEIEPRHIAIWQKHPEAVFTVVVGSVFNSRKVYILGGWSEPSDERSGRH